MKEPSTEPSLSARKETSPRKVAYDELNLGSPYGRECDTCGFSLMPNNAKCYGIAVEPNGERVSVCVVCFQVMVTMNREALHVGDWLGEKPMGGPFTQMILVDPFRKRLSIWNVLDHEPWLEQTQSCKEEVVKE